MADHDEAALPLAEYGSSTVSGRKEVRSRQQIMFGLCGAALVLALVALVQGQVFSPSAYALEATAEASKSAQAHVVGVQQSKAIHELAAAVVARNKIAAAVKSHATSQAVAGKLAQEKAVSAMTHAAHILAHIPTAAIKPEHAAIHAIAAAKEHAVVKPSVLAKSVVASKQERVRASIVKGKMLDDAEPAAAPAAEPAAESPTATPSGDQPAEIFHSPVGDLKPTGIMAVFFNENIMITAVCVIAFLLLAICCFARNADCALT